MIIRFGSNQPSGVTYVPQIAKAPGRLILVSGPSGVGKGTVINGIFADPKIRASVDRVNSITTRSPRPGEVPSLWQRLLEKPWQGLTALCNWAGSLVGKSCPLGQAVPSGNQYRFISEKKFLQLKERGQLFQWANYDNNWYGSRAGQVVDKLNKGINVLFELASKDALQIKAHYPDKVTTVFIAPPAPELQTLRRRLEGRGTNSPESIAERLRKALKELELKPQFDEVIVNEENQLPKAIDQLKEIVARKEPVPPRFMGYQKSGVA